MIEPVPVLTRTSRRHRLWCWRANCCATMPPSDTPRRSTSGYANRLRSSARSSASAGGRYGMIGAGDSPVPGRSTRIVSMPSPSASTKGFSSSRLAPMPLSSRSGHRSPSPGRIATRSRCPSISRYCTCIPTSAITITAQTRKRPEPFRPGYALDSRVSLALHSVHRSRQRATPANNPTVAALPAARGRSGDQTLPDRSRPPSPPPTPGRSARGCDRRRCWSGTGRRKRLWLGAAAGTPQCATRANFNRKGSARWLHRIGKSRCSGLLGRYRRCGVSLLPCCLRRPALGANRPYSAGS